MRTPARHELTVHSEALAEAIASEWNAAEETLDPRAMPLTGLANAATDRVGADPDGFAAGLVKYGENDLLYYRAETPAELIERQAAEWDSLLAWARRRFDVDFTVTSGIIHVTQPAATLARLGHAVAALDSFHLAGLTPLVTIGGSLVAGLAVMEGAVTPLEAWRAVTVDEQWQADQWGSDPEAAAALEARRQEFLAAARFLELLG